MTPTLFCNVAWMNAYKGEEGDPPIGGGKHPEKAERTNFKPSHGTLFGYVRAPGGTLNLARLGADEGAPTHSPVDVVWMATKPGVGCVIVGWYRDATAFRELRDSTRRPHHFTAKAANCHLLEPEKRHLQIERRRRGGPGQSQVWYAQSDYGKDVQRKVECLIYKGQLFSRQNLDDAARSISSSDNVVPAGFKTPLQKTQSVVIYGRCPKVHAHVLNRANGICELCRAPAPFKNDYNTPFLEVHHVKPLAKGGSDEVENAVALCPNCHREAHYGSKRKDVRERLKQVAESTWFCQDISG